MADGADTGLASVIVWVIPFQDLIDPFSDL